MRMQFTMKLPADYQPAGSTSRTRDNLAAISQRSYLLPLRRRTAPATPISPVPSSNIVAGSGMAVCCAAVIWPVIDAV